MMKINKLWWFCALLVLLVNACSLTKNVPEGYYLLKSNQIKYVQKVNFEYDLDAILKQRPNQKTLGVLLKLRMYNLIDSAKIVEKKQERFDDFQIALKKKRGKYERINKKRIAKAKRKGETHYRKKTLTDTIYNHLILRERLKYKFGEEPIVFDSIAYKKTNQQIVNFLRRKGYYNASLSDSIKIDSVKRTLQVAYTLYVGDVFHIDSVFYTGDSTMMFNHSQYLTKRIQNEKLIPLIGMPFDIDILADYRESFAKDQRNNGYYKYSASSIEFIVDTLHSQMSTRLEMKFNPEYTVSVQNPDSLFLKPYKYSRINDVHFHLSDTSRVNGSFSEYCACVDFEDPEYRQFFLTKELIYFNEHNINKNRTSKDSTHRDTSRQAWVHYNGDEPMLEPDILELQNYLEKNSNYKGDYLTGSVKGLSQLGVFRSVKPVIIELPDTGAVRYMDLHYYLEPSKKQSFAFDNRITTSSTGQPGISASANYVNRNLNRNAEKLTVSVGAGFETQTLVFAEDSDDAVEIFNSIEIAPSIQMELVGLSPFSPTALSKRHRARTLITAAYNYEKREIFNKREVFQLNYIWKFLLGSTQVFEVGLPGASVIKLINISPTESFQIRLDSINDPFLSNAYSNQFVWQDASFSYEFNNKNRPFKPGKKAFLGANVLFSASLDAAGNLLSLFGGLQDTTIDGSSKFLNLKYAQFMRIDTKYILSKKLNSKSSIHFRANAGFGLPYGNTTTALPYDYSFSGGGANDNRGWNARTLGPGNYKFHLDPDRTITQIGDIRLGGSLEYRFSLSSIFKGAVFTDFGNIWTYKEDSRNAQFQLQYIFKELAVASGVGLRLDLDYFIVRLDIGLPVYNPAYADGARWIFQDAKDRAVYNQEAIDAGIDIQTLPRPFIPRIHFGLGYPF
ncbi:MAG: BamA/TamA family outer membrane protein [Crocinitomicaceae bacterium]|nr:BamA/TamA family outer membrane protein [Crocinitomicaceae bacterium]MDG1735939.1 BamA/TamA family outer membrane protein [Crocinitomicaceae bacterium]MDG2505827.1 BamA/TamA family outer membrane protein [Crocinitomicaceae bacterium]